MKRSALPNHKIRVTHTSLHIHNMRARMPFRYGIANMTVVPHLFLRLELDIDGQRSIGVASDHLPPKWFTKNPDTPYTNDILDMLTVIRSACVIAENMEARATVFRLWQAIYEEQKRWIQDTQQKYPPLLWGFGVSLVERAMIDAYCRAKKTTFAVAVRDNTLGIRIGAIHPELDAFNPEMLLPKAPLRSIIVRHTVGIGDPLNEDEISNEDRVRDGLPQALLSCMRVYGHTRLKIKLSGEIEADIKRLKSINELINRAGIENFGFTLDGNENFKQVGPFRQLWTELTTDPDLRDFMSRLIFFEQPFHRDVALSPAVGEKLAAWKDRPPIIIDESDATFDSLRVALDYGYSGTSHKNCKGVFKGIANACLIARRRLAASASAPPGGFILSGEDLCNVGPIALLQDLAVMATMGIENVERNGHHYFTGLSMYAVPIQEAMLHSHGDIYRCHDRGFATVDIKDGKLDVTSAVNAPFGYSIPLDPTNFTPLSDWTYDSLEL